MIPTEDLIKAHQYLYYVLGQPVLSDYEYDRLCLDAGVSGGGGSDCEADYPERIRQIANDLLNS